MTNLAKKNVRENLIKAGQIWVPQPHYQKRGKKQVRVAEVVKSGSGVIAIVYIGSARYSKTMSGKQIINHYRPKQAEVVAKLVTPVQKEVKKRRRNSAQVAAHTPIVGQVWSAVYGTVGHVKLVEVGESICGIQDINKHGHTLSTVRAVKHQTLMHKYRFVSDTVDEYAAVDEPPVVSKVVDENKVMSGVPDEVIRNFSDRLVLSLESTMQDVLSEVIMSEASMDVIRAEIRAGVEKAMAPYERQSLDKIINDAVKSAMAPYDASLRSLVGG